MAIILILIGLTFSFIFWYLYSYHHQECVSTFCEKALEFRQFSANKEPHTTQAMLKSIPTLQNLGWLILLTYFRNNSAWYVYTRTTKMRLDKDDLSEVRGLDEKTSTFIIYLLICTCQLQYFLLTHASRVERF